MDFVERGLLSLANMRFYVLDEADRLLDTGNRVRLPDRSISVCSIPSDSITIQVCYLCGLGLWIDWTPRFGTWPPSAYVAQLGNISLSLSRSYAHKVRDAQLPYDLIGPYWIGADGNDHDVLHDLYN